MEEGLPEVPMTELKMAHMTESLMGWKILAPTALPMTPMKIPMNPQWKAETRVCWSGFHWAQQMVARSEGKDEGVADGSPEVTAWRKVSGWSRRCSSGGFI